MDPAVDLRSSGFPKNDGPVVIYRFVTFVHIYVRYRDDGSRWCARSFLRYVVQHIVHEMKNHLQRRTGSSRRVVRDYIEGSAPSCSTSPRSAKVKRTTTARRWYEDWPAVNTESKFLNSKSNRMNTNKTRRICPFRFSRIWYYYFTNQEPLATLQPQIVN
jgi:hypothetical protein